MPKTLLQPWTAFDMLTDMRQLFLVCLMFQLSPLRAASYLCTAEQLAGFVFNPAEQAWQAAASPSEDTFIIRHRSEDGSKNIGPVWFVSERGKEFGVACKNDFDERGFLYCRGLGGDFMMNKNTLRFRHLNDQGYVVDGYKPHLPEGRQSPYMKIGRCEPYEETVVP